MPYRELVTHKCEYRGQPSELEGIKVLLDEKQTTLKKLLGIDLGQSVRNKWNHTSAKVGYDGRL